MTAKEKTKNKKKEVREKNAKKETEIKNKKPVTTKSNVKLFNKWESNIEVKDFGLRRYINLTPRILPRSSGIYRQRFHKSKMHIIERMALHMLTSGHASKKHKITSGHFGGGFHNALSIVENALEKIEEKTKKNPIEVFVRALENAAICEEITTYKMGGNVARQVVITSPQRRVDKALRLFSQAAYRGSFNKKGSVVNSLVNEIIAAYENSNKSFAIKERNRIEQEASGAR